MKKMSILLVTIAVTTVTLQTHLYSGAEVLTVETRRASLPAITEKHTDLRQDIPVSNPHRRASVYARAMADSNEDLTENLMQKILDIEQEMATHGLNNVNSQKLAWYMNMMKAEPSKRSDVLSIIEVLSNDPKTVRDHAQEIADAFNHFLVSSTTTKTSINNLTDNQITMLITMAETMLHNKQIAQGLTIIKQLLGRTNRFIIKPETFQLIKEAILDSNNDKKAHAVILEMLNTSADRIERKAKNALKLSEFADLVESAKHLGFKKSIMKDWYGVITKDANHITINMLKNDPLNMGRLTPILIEQAPEIGIDVLGKLLDSSIMTPENFVELMAIQKASFDSIKPETIDALIKQNKGAALFALFPKILLLETNQRFTPQQRENLRKYVDDLLHSYITVLQQENSLTKIITSPIIKAMDTENLMNMGRLTHMLIEQAPETGIELLAKLMDNTVMTPENFVELIAIQKASLDSIKPEVMATLIKNKADAFVALLPKILRLESNPRFDAKQREVLERHVADLLESYITVLQPAKNNPALASKIKNTMERLVENAKDMLSLTRSIKTLEAMKALITEKEIQQWLQIIASKAQEIRKSDITPAKLNASLNMAALATKAGLDMKTYQQWIKNIVNEAIDLFAMNKLQDREITMEMIDTMQSAAQLLQTQMVFDGLTRLTVEELKSYINKIKAHQTDLINTIDGLLLTQPADSKAIDAKKQILEETYNTLIKKLEANYQIREKAKNIVQ